MEIQEKIVTKYPALGSAVDDTKLALTIKGILVGLVPMIILILSSMGVNLGEGEIMELIDSIVNFISAIAMALSVAMTLAGVVRKLYYKFKK